jgi:hypothetical protein
LLSLFNIYSLLSSQLGGPRQNLARTGHRGGRRLTAEAEVLLQRRKHRLQRPGPAQPVVRASQGGHPGRDPPRQAGRRDPVRSPASPDSVRRSQGANS